MRTIITASLALLLSSCAVAPTAQAVVSPTAPAAVSAVQVSAPSAAGAPAAYISAPLTTPAAASTSLASSEAAALTFMREEEKLARDVYQALGKTWSLPIFINIAASEQTHMDALKTLLDRYGLADPAAGKAAGVFTNQDLQALYTQLVARGTVSLPEALAVRAQYGPQQVVFLTGAPDDSFSGIAHGWLKSVKSAAGGCEQTQATVIALEPVAL